MNRPDRRLSLGREFLLNWSGKRYNSGKKVRTSLATARGGAGYEVISLLEPMAAASCHSSAHRRGSEGNGLASDNSAAG